MLFMVPNIHMNNRKIAYFGTKYEMIWCFNCRSWSWTDQHLLLTGWNVTLFCTRYRQISNIRCTLVGSEIVDHSDVVGALPVGAASTTSSFSTQYMASIDCAETTAWRDEKHSSLGIWCLLYYRFDSICSLVQYYVLRNNHCSHFALTKYTMYLMGKLCRQ